jgi:hypothetical protein
VKRVRVQQALAWVLLVGSVIGYPLTAFWLAKDEPPVVLALSWLAIFLTSFDAIMTAGVAVEQKEKDKDQ